MGDALRKKNLGILWIFFIIYPLLAFVNSVRFPKVKQYRIIVYAFAIFYGYSFVPTPGSDATRYEERASQIGNYSFNEYWQDISTMYEVDAPYNDAYVYTVFFVVSKFSSNPVVYRVVFATIYFYVLLALFYGVYDYVESNKKHKAVFWFVLSMAFALNLSSGINGVRFPLALQLFFLGFFKYTTTKNWKYLILCLSTFLVHFMMGFSLVFLLVFVFSKKFYNPLYALILCLVFFAVSSSGLVTSNSALLGEGIEKRTESYVENEAFREHRNSHLDSVNWYIKFDRYSTYYFGLLSLVLIIAYRRKIYKDALALQFEYFAILMYIASFISAQLVDELSNRYYIFANAAVLIFLYYLSSINNNNKIIRLLTYLFIPIGLLHILIMLRGDQDTFSYNLLMGNIFTTFFTK